MKAAAHGLLITAALSFAGITSAHALEGPGRALVASNVVRLSANTLKSGMNVVKEFIVPYAGVVRLKYQYRSDGVGPGNVSISVNTNIDNNTCSAGTSMTTFQAKTCDIRVVAGDRVIVAGNGFMDIMTFMQSTVFLKNVRLHWTVIDSTGTGAVLAD